MSTSASPIRVAMQHLAHHVRTISENFLKDGGDVRRFVDAGWKAINDSDMMLVPDCSTAVLDPLPRRLR